ncbi:hypothetical protein [Zavarzinia sp. CC-PAN008]|uniref:hypothetical protein n=1 Tax=Zavarzinia sp. CC-PAN008 TaxID=3243332 RepID=UPI003F7455B1
MTRMVIGAAVAAFLALGGLSGRPAGAQQDPVAFLSVDPSPFARTLASEVEVPEGQRSQVRLRKLSETRNPTETVEEWLAKNGLSMNWDWAAIDRTIDAGAFGLPPMAQGLPLDRAVRSPNGAVAGSYGRQGRLIVVAHPGAGQAGLDLSAWTMPPRFVPGDKDYVELETLAMIEGPDKLFVATGHRTYARSSMGLNAFVSAFDPATGKLLWQSDPLVANAGTLVLAGADALIAGYGFTEEPDFLYVLDSRDGTTVQKVPVRSGPETLILKGDRLYVRTYNTDYVFEVKGVQE